MKRNWELIDSIVKTIAESDKDIFGVHDVKTLRLKSRASDKSKNLYL